MAAKKPPTPPPTGGQDDDVAEPRDTMTASMFGDDVPPNAGVGGPPAYQVLARKYRPTRFEDLVGQEAMVRTLSNAFKTGRIAHAFMLTGVRGVGKTTTARLLARALNYESATVHQPSMQLDPPGVHCAAIMAGTHPDILELDAASHTGVSDMRDLLDGSRYAPVSARYKVYIIDEVHMLSTAAFNALLKTLEEPPPHVKFIFATTEIRKVPVTVLSRCQRFNLQRFSTEQLADHLANITAKEGAKVSPEALGLIARAAEGSARDGLSILDQAIVQGDGKEVGAEQVRDMLGLADRSRVLDLMEKIISTDHHAALTEASALLEQGADAPVLIKDLMDAVVEVSRAQALGDSYAYVGPADWAKRTKTMAGQLSPAQSARMWRLLLQGFEDCARAPDPPAAAQMVVLRLAAAASLPPPEDAMRLLAGGAAVPPPKSQPDRDPARTEAPTATVAPASELHSAPQAQALTPQAPAPQDDSHLDDHHEVVRMSSLREIIAELEARREISLKYEIERFVRPAEIDFGHFNYTAAPGTPANLSQKIKDWLESVSGVEWQVMQSGDGSRESTSELRTRRRGERQAAVEAHPRVAEALRLFPGAKVLRIEDPEAQSDMDEIAEPSRPQQDPNVIHVDFGYREHAEQDIPDPEEREDDD
ncbi:MAG TPA: DNA polymerase III subunit gamma/tau [Hyphomonadaceae bacterium]|nr:DNA polymerase III subunit gamma/tau [Hyphomonadaceae bacterium]HPN05911.1 DNA polymerase III subunit gamma/tau [Hyphomonadaceae bacterium]